MENDNALQCSGTLHAKEVVAGSSRLSEVAKEVAALKTQIAGLEAAVAALNA